MVLSSAEYSIAVMAHFPLSFVAILSRGHFSINTDILGFSQNCSYTVLALFFQEGLRDAEDRVILGYVSKLLGLLLYVLGYIPPRLGPWVPMYKWAKATNYWAPQYSLPNGCPSFGLVFGTITSEVEAFFFPSLCSFKHCKPQTQYLN